MGKTRPFDLDWSSPKSKAWVSYGDYAKYPDMPRLSKKEALATPPEFSEVLERLAKFSS